MSAGQTTKPDADNIKQRFFEGMSFAATTVNVVTTDGTAGRVGVTVSAMSSVSADTPRPTLLVCINERSAATDTILENGVFCVNVLRDSQSYISDTFAGRYNDQLDDKFDCADWQVGVLGVPRVRDALVAFDCVLVSTQKIGTHYVCFGEVQDIHIGRHGSSLIYANRAYGVSSKIEQAEAAVSGPLIREESVKLGCFHTFAPFLVPRLAAELRASGSTLVLELVEGDMSRMEEGVQGNELDLSISYGGENHPSMEFTPLMDLEPYILLAEKHPLTAKARISPGDLDGEDMISVKEQASRDMLEGLLRSHNVCPKIVFHAPSFEVARGMVGHGLGFAVLMTKPASSITYDGQAVVSRPLDINTGVGRIGLLTKAGKNSESVTLLKELAQQLFTATPA